MRAATVALVALVTGLALAAPARADDKKEEAKKLFRAGERAFDAGSYDTAAEAFERAYEVLPLPAIAFSAAQAYRLGYFKERDAAKLKRAVQLYRTYIEKQKQGKRVKDAVANLAELEPLLARAESGGQVGELDRAQRTSVVLSSPVSEATGSVDGGEPKKLPFDLEVEPGRHRVVIEAPGYRRFDKQVDLVEGQMRAVEGDLEPLPVKLAVTARPGAVVRVDGRRVGEAPLGQPLPVEAGTHFVAVTLRGHHPWVQQVVGGRGETVKLKADLPMTRQRKISFGFVIGAGALLVGATATGLVALGAGSEAKDLEDQRQAQGLTPAELADYRDARDRRDAARAATLGLGGLGLAVGAVGAILYYFDNTPPGEPPSRSGKAAAGAAVVPLVGGGAAGLALHRRF